VSIGHQHAAVPRRRLPGMRLPDRLGLLLKEVSRFGVVGGFNFALDVALFNLLLFTVLSHQPLAAKGISTVFAATSSYFMNRHWTWDHRARSGLRRELTLFLLLSGVGLLITEACLLVSHYGLGLTSRFADNVSANMVGLVLATTWRFLSFKKWVFVAADERATPAPVGAAAV
jgi:putative flippase GtrA